MFGVASDTVLVQRSAVYRSPMQRLELCDTDKGLALLLNGELQFAEADERAYHDSLVSPGFERNPRAKDVLVLGGGDGLIARSVFEHNPSARVILCDYDPAMTKLFSTDKRAVRLNKASLRRCSVWNRDAHGFVASVGSNSQDLVIADFPDYKPETAKLYSRHMVAHYRRILRPNGVASLYAGGSPPAFAQTLESYFGNVQALPLAVESMGFGLALVAQKR